MDARQMLSTGLTVVAMTALSAACLIGPEPQALPSFALTNQSGAVIRAEQLHGRVAIISFMFTGCSEACPLVMSQLARAQADVLAAGLGSRVRFTTITLDPVTDTPAVLRRYAASFGVDTNGWDFLTGDPAEVGRVVRAMGMTTVRADGRLGHDSLVVFVNTRGDIVRRYTETTRLAARIVSDIKHAR
jgi:protein SCO1